MDIEFITPQTPEEADQYRQQLLTLLAEIGISGEEAASLIEYQIPNLTIVFADRFLVASFWLQCFKTSAELHGTYFSRFNEKAPPQVRRQIKHTILRIVFEHAFKGGREKLITKLDPANKLGRAFVLGWGFKRLENNGRPVMDEGREVWKLDKKDYYFEPNRRHTATPTAH